MVSKMQQKTDNDILGKCAGQCLLAADLLAADKGLDSDSDSTVNVLGGTVF
jgi:hypothetical protein